MNQRESSCGLISVAGVRDVFLGAVQEQGAVVGAYQSRRDGLQALALVPR